MEFTSGISGIANLDKLFAQLPKTTQRRAIAPSLRAGGAEIRDLAVDNLKSVISPDSTGIGEKNIRVYTLRKYKGYYRVSVQVKRGAVNEQKIVNGEPVRVGLYLSVLEYGKENQPPRSWIRKAIREGRTKAVNRLIGEMRKRMVLAIEDAKK